VVSLAGVTAGAVPVRTATGYTDSPITVDGNGAGPVNIDANVHVDGHHVHVGTLCAGIDAHTIDYSGTVYSSDLASAEDGGTNAAQLLLQRWASGASSAPRRITGRSKGTQASPTTVADNDVLAEDWVLGYDGTNFRMGGRIRWLVDGTVSTGVIPSEMLIQLCDSGGALQTPLTITPTSVSVPDATSGTHALNRTTGDARYGQYAASNTWSAAQTFTAINYVQPQSAGLSTTRGFSYRLHDATVVGGMGALYTAGAFTHAYFGAGVNHFSAAAGNAGITATTTQVSIHVDGTNQLTATSTSVNVTQLNADNLRLDGNTISSTTGEVIIAPSSGKINNKPVGHDAPGSLFILPKNEDEIGYVGGMEITSIECVADVAGSLNEKYFRLYGAAGTSSALDTTAAEQIIDVWFDVDGAGSAPSTGAGRMIEADIATDATAEAVAAAVSAALNADPAFSAGIDGATVIVAHMTPTNFTNGSAGDSGFTVTTETDGSGSLAGSSKWIGGVLAPNGCIYGIPFNSTSVLKIDPITDTVSTFGSLAGLAKWVGGVLAPNGCIYGIPHSSTSVLKIDPITDTVSTFGSLAGSNKWVGGVLAPNGCIYGIPHSSTSVLKIDPITDTVSTFGSLAGSNKWYGGVLAPNGCIYGIPHSSTSVLKIRS
jgi:hypothetical protein